MKKCSMQKKIESLSKKQESAGTSFYDEFIADRAREILEAYDMNDTQGVPGSGEGWDAHDVKEVKNTYSDGTPRDDFNAGVEKEFIGYLGYFHGTGYYDNALGAEIDKEFDEASNAYLEANSLSVAPEDGTDEYEDYMDAIDEWLGETYLVGEASILFVTRGWRNSDYSLHASIFRHYDAGSVIDGELRVTMNLSSDQLTQENADKFIKAVEEAFASYSFSQGDKDIEVKAD